MYTIQRYHDISCGHRVVGHESKCKHLHGHNYRIHFTIAQDEDQLNELGMVMDFSQVKEKLCNWLESHWDHSFLIFNEDPLKNNLVSIAPNDFVIVPFNPTAEEIAKYLVKSIAPYQLEKTGCKLISCTVEETRKCSATYEI